MLLDELVASIGSERDSSSASSSSRFSWISDESEKLPTNADLILATSLSSSEIRPTSAVVRCICRGDMLSAAMVAISSAYIHERDSLSLLAKFPSLVEVFLSVNNYSPDKLRQVVREDLGDEAVLQLIDNAILTLESSLDKLSVEKRELLLQYVRFVSVLVDAKFVQWYVKAGGGSATGTRIARLSAIVNKYRRELFAEQQTRIKEGEGRAETLIKASREPVHDGRIFFHQLSI